MHTCISNHIHHGLDAPEPNEDPKQFPLVVVLLLRQFLFQLRGPHLSQLLCLRGGRDGRVTSLDGGYNSSTPFHQSVSRSDEA